MRLDLKPHNKFRAQQFVTLEYSITVMLYMIIGLVIFAIIYYICMVHVRAGTRTQYNTIIISGGGDERNGGISKQHADASSQPPQPSQSNLIPPKPYNLMDSDNPVVSNRATPELWTLDTILNTTQSDRSDKDVVYIYDDVEITPYRYPQDLLTVDKWNTPGTIPIVNSNDTCHKSLLYAYPIQHEKIMYDATFEWPKYLNEFAESMK